jgi:hypothetical protein
MPGTALSGEARAAGGLLGVVGGEAWRGSRSGFESGGPVSAALVDLARAYVSDPDGYAPTHIANQHEGVPGPGWLLPVAIIRSDPATREREVRELADAAGMGAYQIPACIAYIELAANLFVADQAEPAPVRAVEDGDHALVRAPRLLGIGAADGLAAGSWALARQGDLAQVIPSLVRSGQNLVAPWVAAAAGGLVGVRDGRAAVPGPWHRRLPRRQRQACAQLAQALVELREPSPAAAAVEPSVEPLAG